MAEINNRKNSQTERLLKNGRLDSSIHESNVSSVTTSFTQHVTSLDDANDVKLCGSGQLVLGRDSSVIRPYITRYRVKRNEHRYGTCIESLHKTIAPCCRREIRSSCVDFITAVLKSEAFLLIIHLAAVSVGVTKESLDLRINNDKLHFVLTIFEKVLCIAGILLRVFAVYNEYKDVYESLVRLEASENDKSIYSKSVRLWSVIFTLLSSLAIFLVVASFILLHLYAHLGWTILTTSTSILLILALHHVIKTRNDLVLYRITLDHHKVLLEESLMFLKEGLCFKGWVNQDFLVRCREYVLAYDVTREFVRPPHIDVCEGDELCVSLNVTTV